MIEGALKKPFKLSNLAASNIICTVYRVESNAKHTDGVLALTAVHNTQAHDDTTAA